MGAIQLFVRNIYIWSFTQMTIYIFLIVFGLPQFLAYKSRHTWNFLNVEGKGAFCFVNEVVCRQH